MCSEWFFHQNVMSIILHSTYKNRQSVHLVSLGWTLILKITVKLFKFLNLKINLLFLCDIRTRRSWAKTDIMLTAKWDHKWSNWPRYSGTWLPPIHLRLVLNWINLALGLVTFCWSWKTPKWIPLCSWLWWGTEDPGKKPLGW